MSDFFSVDSTTQIISFRLSEIVAIETPNWPRKPTGWVDEIAACVFLRNRTDCISLDSAQWAQLKDRLGC